MPDLFTLNQEYSFCLSKARVICVKMTSSIDSFPTHCACTLRQHYEYIEEHTQRFFSHPVASCNVHLVLFPCICWDFTKILLCEWRSWFIKPDFTSIQEICPAVLELRQGHSTPIPSHDISVEPCYSNHLLLGKWLKSTQKSCATCGRASRDGTHVCLEGRRRVQWSRFLN